MNYCCNIYAFSSKKFIYAQHMYSDEAVAANEVEDSPGVSEHKLKQVFL